MAVPAQDGAWITATTVTQIHCTVCGFVLVTKYPTNDRETQDLISEHLKKHGGRWKEGIKL